MKDIELKNKVIRFLVAEHETTKIFPREFTAKESAEMAGGLHTRVGVIASSVVDELTARGINIRYEKDSNPRKFVMEK